MYSLSRRATYGSVVPTQLYPCLRGPTAQRGAIVKDRDTYIGCMVANGRRVQELVNFSPLILGRDLSSLDYTCSCNSSSR